MGKVLHQIVSVIGGAKRDAGDEIPATIAQRPRGNDVGLAVGAGGHPGDHGVATFRHRDLREHPLNARDG
jgi:hypothetical protein